MFSRFQLTKSVAVLAALAATALSAPSAASAEDQPVLIYGEVASARSELVSFANLDLANEHDRKKLRHRVAAAVERVCLREIGRDGLQLPGYYACESDSMGAASSKIAEAVSRAGNLASAGGGVPIAATAILVSAR